MFIFDIFIAIVITEALTEIVTKSEIFLPFRAGVFNLGKRSKFFEWFHNLLDCGYCFSVWVGCAVAFLFLKDVNLVHDYVDWFILGLFIHRMSNAFHNIMDRIHGT